MDEFNTNNIFFKFNRINIMKILFHFVCLILLIGCKEKSEYRKAAEEIAANLPDTRGLNIGVAEYELIVPNGWTESHFSEFGIDYYFISAPKTLEDQNTNVNVITESMNNYSLQTYTNKAIDGLKAAIPTAVILSRGEYSTNGIKASWYKYNMAPRGIKVILTSYIFPKDNIAYVVTCGTQLRDTAKHEATFKMIIRSFKFKT